jgi:hypothetical protein
VRFRRRLGWNGHEYNLRVWGDFSQLFAVRGEGREHANLCGPARVSARRALL